MTTGSLRPSPFRLAPPLTAPPERVRRPMPITVAHRAEYVAMRGAVSALRGLGVRGASGVGARLGGLGLSPLRIRRDVVQEQLAKAFPDLPAETIGDI